MDITSHLEKQKIPLIEAVKDLVRIPSVIAEGQDGFPFGPAIDAALRKALQIAGELGFRVFYDPQGYYGYAEIGAGKEMVGVLGHVDGVPAGSPEQWQRPAFDPVVQDGRLYGRGAQDDKGPTLAALFAVKALLEAGVSFNRRVRFIFGADEENLWRCVRRYLQIEETTTLGFTPDSRFPLIYAEKGLLQVVLEGGNHSGFRLSGGNTFNAVPDLAIYEGPRQTQLAAELDRLGYAYDQGENRLRVIGKSAHAQATEEGVNAITRLAQALLGIGQRAPALEFIVHVLGADAFGRGLFGDCQDEISGRLKCNLGILELGEQAKLCLDLRIPVSVEKDWIVSRLQGAAEKHGFSYSEREWLAPLYVPLDTILVQTLLQIYRQVTGDAETQPYTAGGATYARAMPNCVAFGAVFPGRPKVEHQPDEYIRLDDLYQAMQIYAQAIYALTR
jgi:predicted dipeptidase